MKYKVCYVSHDLQNRKIQNKEIAYFKKTKEKKVLLDMIIVKKENILKWKNVFE